MTLQLLKEYAEKRFKKRKRFDEREALIQGNFSVFRKFFCTFGRGYVVTKECAKEYKISLHKCRP